MNVDGRIARHMLGSKCWFLINQRRSPRLHKFVEKEGNAFTYRFNNAAQSIEVTPVTVQRMIVITFRPIPINLCDAFFPEALSPRGGTAGATERSRVQLSLLAGHENHRENAPSTLEGYRFEGTKKVYKKRLESITTEHIRKTRHQTRHCSRAAEVDRVAAQNNEPTLYKVNNYESERTSRSTCVQSCCRCSRLAERCTSYPRLRRCSEVSDCLISHHIMTPKSAGAQNGEGRKNTYPR
jgi:hypothetical protein